MEQEPKVEGTSSGTSALSAGFDPGHQRSTLMDLVEDLNRTASGWATPYSDALERAANEIERLNLELQKRDKCSFMGPMRDCPTHGDSKDAARYQWLRRQPWVKTKGIYAWGELLDNAIDEARHDAPTETPNVELTGAAPKEQQPKQKEVEQ